MIRKSIHFSKTSNNEVFWELSFIAKKQPVIKFFYSSLGVAFSDYNRLPVFYNQ